MTMPVTSTCPMTVGAPVMIRVEVIPCLENKFLPSAIAFRHIGAGIDQGVTDGRAVGGGPGIIARRGGARPEVMRGSAAMVERLARAAMPSRVAATAGLQKGKTTHDAA